MILIMFVEVTTGPAPITEEKTFPQTFIIAFLRSIFHVSDFLAPAFVQLSIGRCKRDGRKVTPSVQSRTITSQQQTIKSYWTSIYI